MQDDEDWAALGLVSVPADRMRDDLEPHVHVELHAYDAERRSTRAVAYAVPADAVTTQGRR